MVTLPSISPTLGLLLCHVVYGGDWRLDSSNIKLKGGISGGEES